MGYNHGNERSGFLLASNLSFLTAPVLTFRRALVSILIALGLIFSSRFGLNSRRALVSILSRVRSHF